MWGTPPPGSWGAKPDLRLAKVGGRMCVRGGINAVLTLGEGTPVQARQTGEEALSTLAAGGGFVLFPVDQIVVGTPWENIEAMLERWRELA